MYLTIITPVTRYENLSLIQRSINIPSENYRWICVFDSTSIPKNLPSKCEAYNYVNSESKVGNAQRNFAINLVKDGHIYFVDDDVDIHPSLWRKIQNLDNHDFIHFSQINKNGSLRLKGNIVAVNSIDSHTFIVKRELIGDTRWIINEYAADGIFAEECYKKSINPIFIPKVLSIYNSLR
jgi:hypothetical protein